MNAGEIANIETRCCAGKKRYGANAARDIAAARSTSTIRISPYRCPFCEGWHVGHTPSMESVRTIAEAIRERAYPHVA